MDIDHSNNGREEGQGEGWKGDLPATPLKRLGLLQTPIHQSRHCGSNIPDVAIRSQASQDELDLRAFIRIVTELCMVQKWIQNPEVRMSQLGSVSFLLKHRSQHSSLPRTPLEDLPVPG